MRVGQKNKLTYRWARKGSRPRAVHDQRTQSTYLFGAVCPELGTGAALVLPACNSEAMQLHLDEIAIKVSPGAHAILLLDQAGWHGAKILKVPSNITLMPLPPRAPELNGQENIWQFMRQNWLSQSRCRSPARLILEIDMRQRVPGVVLHDEAGVILLDHRPGRRAAADHAMPLAVSGAIPGYPFERFAIAQIQRVNAWRRLPSVHWLRGRRRACGAEQSGVPRGQSDLLLLSDAEWQRDQQASFAHSRLSRNSTLRAPRR